MTDRIDTGINENTKVIANVLNYDDDMAILQQGSLRSIRRFFHKVEHPDIPILEDKDIDDIESNKNKSNGMDVISINSISFMVKFVILILMLIIMWDFLRTK